MLTNYIDAESVSNCESSASRFSPVIAAVSAPSGWPSFSVEEGIVNSSSGRSLSNNRLRAPTLYESFQAELDTELYSKAVLAVNGVLVAQLKEIQDEITSTHFAIDFPMKGPDSFRAHWRKALDVISTYASQEFLIVHMLGSELAGSTFERATSAINEREPLTEGVYSSFRKPSKRVLKVERLLNLSKHNLQWKYASSFIERVQGLEQAAQEEGPEQKPLSFFSLRSLVSFLDATKPKLPSLTLTFEGFLVAEWKKSPRNKVSVIFFPNRTVSVVGFLPSKEFPYGTNRINNTMDLQNLQMSLQGLNLKELILE